MSDETPYIDAHELVGHHWPLDGPYGPELAEAAAVAAAALVRYLNHATGPGATSALPFASHGYALAGSLRAAADGHTQLLGQLADWAGRLAADPTLRHAQHRDVPERAREAARAASDALWAARVHADCLGARLAVAQSALTWLAHDIDDEGEPDE